MLDMFSVASNYGDRNSLQRLETRYDGRDQQLTSASEPRKTTWSVHKDLAECRRPPFHCLADTPEGLQLLDRDTQEQVLSDLLESPHQITEAELRGFCKVQVKARTCEVNHEKRCLAEPLQPIFHGFLNRSLALGGVCERPDFFSKAQVLLGCVRSALKVYRKYTQEERRSFDRQTDQCQAAVVLAPRALAPYMQPISLEPLVLHNETALLTGACCQLKKIVTCLPRVLLIRQECTFEAVDLGRTILKGLFDYYQCPETLATNVCPKIDEHNPWYPLRQENLH